MSELRTHRPTGVRPWPLLLLEGEDHAGIEWDLAQLALSDRVGRLLWLELGHRYADELGQLSDSHEVIEHDGTYADVLGQVLAAKAVAQAEIDLDRGRLPTVLVLTGMTELWDGLKDWTADRARTSRAGREARALDPAADVRPGRLWDDTTHRHARLSTALLTFPGPVVVTARGAQHVESGTYRVDTHKSLTYDATVWVRYARRQAPVVIGARAATHAVFLEPPPPWSSEAPVGGYLDWLVFDALGVDRFTPSRDVVPFVGGDLLPEERPEAEARTGQRTYPTPEAFAARVDALTDPAELDRLADLARLAWSAQAWDRHEYLAAVERIATRKTQETPAP